MIMTKRTTGEKIKRISSIICIIMAFFCIAAGIVTYSFGMEDGVLFTQYLGIAIIPVGCLTFCLISLIFSGFAEIVDNTTKIAKYVKVNGEEEIKALEEIENETKKVKLALECKNQ
jgi:hypothetical protein